MLVTAAADLAIGSTCRCGLVGPRLSDVSAICVVPSYRSFSTMPHRSERERDTEQRTEVHHRHRSPRTSPVGARDQLGCFVGTQ
jgi:hypothetical protein